MHLPVLDGLRGIAIASVLAGHSQMLKGAWTGVDLFFVLSGFLITSLLLREKARHGSINLFHFYLRRALRLLPVTFAFLAVSWIVVLTLGDSSAVAELRGDSATILLYCFNWHMISHGPGSVTKYIGHLWSLSVEEQFYLVWPFVVVGLTSFGRRRKWLVMVAVAGVLIPPIIRWLLVCDSTLPLTDFKLIHRVFMGTDVRADSLAIGCLLGILTTWCPKPQNRWQRQILQWAGCAAAAVFIWHLFAVSSADQSYLCLYGGHSLAALANATLLASLVWSPPPGIASVLSLQPLCWLGRISYGLYVWHWPITWYLRTHLTLPHAWTKNLLIASCGIAAGAISFYLLEMPFLRLKSRLGSRRADPKIPVECHPVAGVPSPHSVLPADEVQRHPAAVALDRVSI